MTIIKLSKSGVQPPVYIAGSFSDPAWLPQEMEYRIDRNGEYEYFKDAPAEDGKEYQYKFRLGPGDWWILDEESPTGRIISSQLSLLRGQLNFKCPSGF